MFATARNRWYYLQLACVQQGSKSERMLAGGVAALGTFGLGLGAFMIVKIMPYIRHIYTWWFAPADYGRLEATYTVLAVMLPLGVMALDVWKSLDVYSQLTTLSLVLADFMTVLMVGCGAWLNSTSEVPASRLLQAVSSGDAARINGWLQGVPWPYWACAAFFALFRLVVYGLQISKTYANYK